MNRTDITKWTAPHWHPDLGSAERELAMLKQVAKGVVDRDPRFGVSLECLEPGYMFVRFDRDNKDCAELWIVNAKSEHRFGLFTIVGDCEEVYYFDDPSDGVERMISLYGQS